MHVEVHLWCSEKSRFIKDVQILSVDAQILLDFLVFVDVVLEWLELVVLGFLEAQQLVNGVSRWWRISKIELLHHLDCYFLGVFRNVVSSDSSLHFIDFTVQICVGSHEDLFHQENRFLVLRLILSHLNLLLIGSKICKVELVFTKDDPVKIFVGLIHHVGNVLWEIHLVKHLC